jgi:hypothetical protein
VTDLVRSELLKVRTTRGWWAYLIVLVGLVGIGAAAEVGSRSVDERSGLDFQLALVDLVGITSLLVGASIYTSVAGGALALVDGDVAERAGKTVLGVVLWLLMGLAIGSVVHSQVAALVGTLLWLFLVETLLVGLFNILDAEGVAEYLPFHALDGADGSGGDNLLDYGPALAVTCGWIVLLGAAGLARTVRRDIT